MKRTKGKVQYLSFIKEGFGRDLVLHLPSLPSESKLREMLSIKA